MALRLDDKWIWDFWLVAHAGRHHIFYLQAPKSIGDPDRRHWNVSIGHAISPDLINWEIAPDALGPGLPGAWDDASTWTGSIIEDDGRWHMLYTGTSTRESGRRQRVGLAVSDDLFTWDRVGDGPVLEADPRWYETIDTGTWHDEAWRDPWVIRSGDGMFHAIITARSNTGPVYGRGVLAHARSEDLRQWEVLPPITEPDGFGQLEVSQIIASRGEWYLLFCSDLATQSLRRRRDGPGSGTYYVRAEQPFGPYRIDQARPLAVDHLGSSYAGRLVDLGEQGLHFLAWEWMHPRFGFTGAISDPRPVEVTETGELRLADRG